MKMEANWSKPTRILIRHGVEEMIHKFHIKLTYR